MNFFNRTSLALHPAASGRDQQGLPQRVGVPGGSAPGSNVTMAPVTRAGSVPLNGESIRTVPVNQSAGPLLEGCEPTRMMFIIQTVNHQ